MTRIMNTKRLARMQAQQDRADFERGVTPKDAKRRGAGYTRKMKKGRRARP
jgi:hypothetical protein